MLVQATCEPLTSPDPGCWPSPVKALSRCASSSRPLDNPRTFVQDAAHNGFNPAETMALYLERRYFLRHTLVVDPRFHEPKLHADCRLQVTAIRLPIEWHNYVEDWPAKYSHHLSDSDDLPWCIEDGSEDTAEEACPGNLRNSLKWREKSALKTPLGHWTWMEVHRAIQNDFIDAALGPHRPYPRRWTTEVGKRCLRRLIRRLGLSGIQWPSSAGEQPELLWSLFITLRRQQQHLTRVSGWRGPVLGLGQGLWLRLGYELDYRSGGSFSHQSWAPVINANWFRWDSVLSHEWFHALDCLARQSSTVTSHGWRERDVLSLTSLTKVSSETRPWIHRAMLNLVHAVDRPGPVPTDYEIGCDQWSTQLLPKIFTADDQKFTHKLWLSWSKEVVSSNRKFTQRSFCRTGPTLSGRVEMLENREDNIFAQVLGFASGGLSVRSWWDRCDHVGRIIQRNRVATSAGDRNNRQEVWWLATHEHLAIAFESWVHRSEIMSSNWAAPMFPTPEECENMSPAWSDFFRRLAPFWRQVAAAYVPPVSPSTALMKNEPSMPRCS